MTRSKHRDQLEEMYQEQTDPWNYLSHDEEIRKYSATLDAIPDRRFRAALEIGCAEGAFTRSLASHSDSVLGIDVSATAIERARDRCADVDNVSFQVVDFIGDELDERFDLIVVSEVLYYVPFLARRPTARKVRDWLDTGGVLVLCHTRKEYTRDWKDVYAESGAEGLHALFTTGAGMREVSLRRFNTFDVLVLENPEQQRKQLAGMIQGLALDARTLPSYLAFGARRLLYTDRLMGRAARVIVRRLPRKELDQKTEAESRVR